MRLIVKGWRLCINARARGLNVGRETSFPVDSPILIQTWPYQCHEGNSVFNYVAYVQVTWRWKGERRRGNTGGVRIIYYVPCKSVEMVAILLL